MINKNTYISYRKTLDKLNEGELETIRTNNREREREDRIISDKREQVVDDLGNIIKAVRAGKMDGDLISDYSTYFNE